MQTENKKAKGKSTPKLSALAMGLITVFLVVACGGGGSAVGSDSADSVKAGTGATGASGASGTSGSSGTSGTAGTSGMDNDDDDDDCKTTTTTTTTTTAANSKEKDDDDKNEIEDDDDKKCSTSPPKPPVATATGALGKIAWIANCASCHTGDLGKGRSASDTLSAIASNKGGVMGALSGKITMADAANIAEYTKNPSLYP